LIDSNVPMYVVGAEHPHKGDAQRLLDRRSPSASAW
jgi:predicted nucleic acid-binding protein